MVGSKRGYNTVGTSFNTYGTMALAPVKNAFLEVEADVFQIFPVDSELRLTPS
jgi:hypothetical protein